MTNETQYLMQHTPGPWVPYVGPMNMDGGLNPFFRGIVALVKNAGEPDDVCVILYRNEDYARLRGQRPVDSGGSKDGNLYCNACVIG